MELNNKIYTELEETLKKYGISEEAKDDVAETLQKAEDYIISLTIGLT